MVERGDRVRYRGFPGTVRSVAHWLSPASLDVRLDDGRLIYDLETHFEGGVMQAIAFQVAMRPDSQAEVIFFPWTGYDFGVPGLAVSPSVELDGEKPKRRCRLWAITHLPSGLRIGPEFSSRGEAAAVGLELGELLSDWSYPASLIQSNLDLVEAGRYIVYGGVES